MKIEFFTNNNLALNFPPMPAKKFIPEWYKGMDMLIKDATWNAKNLVQRDAHTSYTIRGCVPVLDYLTSGYVLRAHSDILITPEKMEDDIVGIWWKSNGTSLETHAHKQCPVKIHNKKNDYFKFLNPWVVKTPKGYSTLFYQPEYFFNGKFKCFPAIVDTDKYNEEPIHFPAFAQSEESFMVKAGEPIMIAFPFKREEWVAEVREATEKESTKVNALKSYMIDGYKKIFHQKKSYN